MMKAVVNLIRGLVVKGGMAALLVVVADPLLHPLRVMLKMRTSEGRTAAALHDVVEDSDTTLEDLRNEGFPDAVVDVVDAVTKRIGESYDDFVRRAARNPIGRRVKLADLEDNSDLSRIANPTEADYERLAKYQRAIESISSISRR